MNDIIELERPLKNIRVMAKRRIRNEICRSNRY